MLTHNLQLLNIVSSLATGRNRGVFRTGSRTCDQFFLIAPGTKPYRNALYKVEYKNRETAMNGIIYLVGLVVVVLFILSLLGLG